MTAKFSKKKGFTLVEILIVLAVISMVMLLGVSSYGMARKKIQLDIAANSFEATIVEARDKTRSGYYDMDDPEVSQASSFCFGFSIEKEGFITLLRTDYNRLAQTGSKCDTQNAIPTINADLNEDIVVKELSVYGEQIQDSIEVFFAPPDAAIEFEKPGVVKDEPELRAVLGYADSDEDTNKRVVVFNVLTGSTYAQTFIENEE